MLLRGKRCFVSIDGRVTLPFATATTADPATYTVDNLLANPLPAKRAFAFSVHCILPDLGIALKAVRTS